MGWQDLVALGIVAGAVAYLIVKFCARRTGGCSGCGLKEECPTGGATTVELKMGPFRAPQDCCERKPAGAGHTALPATLEPPSD